MSSYRARFATEKPVPHWPALLSTLRITSGVTSMPPVGGWETGVYCIKCRASGKVYIGGAYKSIGSRIGLHKRDLRLLRHSNRHLQSAWVKYGAKQFTFLIIERCGPKKVIESRETYWIAFYRATDRRYGYNICPIANSVLGMQSPVRGRKMQPEFCQSIRQAKSSKSHRLMMSELVTAQWQDLEIRHKQSTAIRLAWQNESLRQLKSIQSKQQWADPRIRAKHLAARRSLDARKRNSEAQKAAWDRKKQVQATNQNRNNSDEDTLG